MSIRSRPETHASGNRLAVLALLLANLSSLSPAPAQTSVDIKTVTKPQITAVTRTKADRTPIEEKMTSDLLDSLAVTKTGVVNANVRSIQQQMLPRTDDGKVKILIRTVDEHAPGLADAIRAKGEVTREDPHEITAAIPLKDLPGLAARDDVQKIRTLRDPKHNADGAMTLPIAHEGAYAHAVDAGLVRDYGVSGKGVTVCVISDSVDDGGGQSLQKSASNGAIDPARLHILDDQDGWGDGEGLAMLEIVHAIAPDAELWFATGYGGANQMAANILALAGKGCNIIVDDLTYPEESPFQEDAIGRAIEDVSARGMLYFSSAGNNGSHYQETSGVWEGDFSDGGPASKYSGTGRIHMWKSGITLNTVEDVDDVANVALYWSDPLGHSTNGYDLYVVKPGGAIVLKSDTSRTPGSDPYQYVGQVHQGYSIVVVKHDDAEPRYLHIVVTGGHLRHNTPGAVRGHNASPAPNAYSVAAKGAVKGAVFKGGDQETVQEFSSDGPRRMFYAPDGTEFTPGKVLGDGGKVIFKPDITAADDVSTTLDAFRLNPFKGTSAAAPHAAGIAALLLSCTPRPGADQIREAFRSTALSLGDGQSGMAGYGVIMARPAVEKICQRIAAPAPVVATTQISKQ